MHHNLERVAQQAHKIRAYTVSYSGESVFGKAYSRQLHCYYGLVEGSLRYLTVLYPNKEGRIHPSEINRAVLTAYAKLAGKNVRKIVMFGIYAD